MRIKRSQRFPLPWPNPRPSSVEAMAQQVWCEDCDRWEHFATWHRTYHPAKPMPSLPLWYPPEPEPDNRAEVTP
jgi:hypothetical protein